MSAASLASRLVQLPGFQKRLRELTVDSVRRQFPAIAFADVLSPPPDLNYLLSCASVLAHSLDGDSQDAAFRIAQYALSSAPDVEAAEVRAASAFIFETLTTKPAITLALARKLLAPNYEDSLPLPLRFDLIGSQVANSLYDPLADTLLPLNRFQMQVHRGIETFSWILVMLNP